MSGCFSRRTSETIRPVLVHWSSGRRHPPPYQLVALQTACRSFPESTVSWKPRSTASSSSSLMKVDLPSQADPSASASPTRPSFWTLSQRSMRLVILSRISRARRTTNVFVRTKWAKTRGLSEFQLLLRSPRHSAARIAVNQRPTAPEGVAYQLADCAASRRQRRCHTASSAIPPFRCAA